MEEHLNPQHEPQPESREPQSSGKETANAGSPESTTANAGSSESTPAKAGSPESTTAGGGSSTEASPQASAASEEPAQQPPKAQEPTEAPEAQEPPQDQAPQRTEPAPAIQGSQEKKDFGEILAQFESGSAERRENPAVGEKVRGKVLSIGEEAVFIDLGTKSEGMIEVSQLRNAEGNLTVNAGDTVEAIVTGVDPESGVLLLRKKTGAGRGGQQEVAAELRQAHQYGMPVEGLVSGINKGGAEVQVHGMRAFCPLSQLDLRYVENPQQFVGQRLSFRVTRIEEGGRNRRPDIVLSRRALLEEEAQARAAEVRAHLRVGSVVKGKVTSLTTYGAFIDLGGLEGLLHVSEIGFSRLSDPKEALSVGQEIEVQVIKIEKGRDEKRPVRISLSRRALERDPWRDAPERFPEGSVVAGRVVRLESFGAFVELSPGLEGLVHVSELGTGRRISHAREAVQLGQDVKVRVLGVDTAKRRISLSLAGTGADEEARQEEPAPRETAAAGQPATFGSLGDFFKSSGNRRR
ncbi:MAG TPA: S1 RNA-binding domain-containing protein [Thermoanaerobaculia bacterium]|nr:S1 RNA-binding domain-containing protein [Thermoanaerobaculia bacterium]